MSATNRGSVRVESDFYATPEKVIHNFLKHYRIPFGTILEPSAGCGNFLKVLREQGHKGHITSVETRAEELTTLDFYSNEIIIDDFLSHKFEYNKFDYIIGNPPYSLAIEFLEKCFSISNPKNTTIIMLLRTAFLESKKRYDFWQRHPVNHLYVLSERPSFLNNGKSDATSYSFFIWDGSNTQSIHVI
jgi:hypothetical protein